MEASITHILMLPSREGLILGYCECMIPHGVQRRSYILLVDPQTKAKEQAVRG